jgi:hypothetical protein
MMIRVGMMILVGMIRETMIDGAMGGIIDAMIEGATTIDPQAVEIIIDNIIMTIDPPVEIIIDNTMTIDPPVEIIIDNTMTTESLLHETTATTTTTIG